MRDVYIIDGEILTGAGSLDSTWATLMKGQTALFPRKLEKADPYPLGFIDHLKAGVGKAARLEELLCSLFQTLPQLPPETPVICATTKAAVDELFTHPNENSGQIWQIGKQINAMLELNGQTSVVSAACASGTIAIIQGAMSIGQGNNDLVLVVALDILSNFVVGGFGSLKGLSSQPCKPFDKKRDGLSIGEGAGWLLLSSSKEKQNGNFFSCQVKNWSVSCDATHITAPCRKASGLKRILNDILSNSKDPIGAINAHGTGTIYNDAMELLAFDQCFNNDIPICSVKGCIGHCLGAAGLIETIISLKSLEKQHIPPTVGLDEPENGNMNISGNAAIPLQHPTILSCNSGFGGINAAVLLSPA